VLYRFKLTIVGWVLRRLNRSKPKSEAVSLLLFLTMDAEKFLSDPRRPLDNRYLFLLKFFVVWLHVYFENSVLAVFVLLYFDILDELNFGKITRR
jgi:hypothetical protein